MSTAARIDELRKKFEENPRRYFAPLANEYRKAGDLAMAIGLCREHLPKQPGHMSGYIVFGQALYEARELDEARTVFEQALALDPENLIALRHLGDIAHASGDVSAARRWYERVLDADPRNDDIAAQLASLATGATPASTPVVPAVPSSVQPFVRNTETPSIAMSAIGLPAMPTPDAVLRAVDFDVINARVQHRTPLDLDAIEASASVAPAESEGVHAPDVVDDEEDAFGFPDEPVTAASATAVDAPQDSAAGALTDNLDVDEAFEEGLVAPEWPDTSDLVARVVTPRSVTPRSATPVFSDVTIDTVAAFGREAGDPIDAVSEIAEDVGPLAELEPTTVAPLDAALEASAPAELAPTELASAELAPTEREAADSHEPVENATRVTDTYEWVSVSMPTPAAAVDTVELVEFTSGVVESPAPAAEADPEHVTAEALAESAVDMTVDMTVDTPVEAAADQPSDLPWLAVADAESVDAVAGPDAEPGLEELAEAFAEDARGAGDDSVITVSALELDATDGVQESIVESSIAESVSVEEMPVAEAFDVDANEVEAPVAEAPVVEAHDAEPLPTPESSPTAFVTETMGELLVSQGFLARAIDVYEELVRRRPYDPVLSARLGELQAMAAHSEPTAESAAVTEAPESLSDTFEDGEPAITADGTPAWGTPGVQPVMPTPSYGTPAYGAPAYGAPAYGTPAYGTPAYGTPAYGMTPPIAVPALADTAAWVTPISATPISATPVRSTPYSQPAALDERAAYRSAREWFAALAARRVPRRTPPQPSPAIAPPAEGLASLFGADASQQDDAAARALADAFAPVSSDDLASGAALDFEFARSTPAFSPSAIAARTPLSSPVVAPTPPASPATPAHHETGSTNAGFSFDKFFPDPATRRPTPASSQPTTPDAPVTDDLAQFSAWLKGLGNP